jgi:hypothetical protein
VNPPRQNRIIFINRFYCPDETATAQLLTDLAEGLAARGHRIAVIASHDGNPGNPRRENRRGVEIIRVSATRWGKRGIAAKAVDYATFAMAIRRCLRAEARAGDCMVAMTDPPVLALIAAAAAHRTKANAIHWLQDIHPEISSSAGPGSAGATPLGNRRKRVWRSAVTWLRSSVTTAYRPGRCG